MASNNTSLEALGAVQRVGTVAYFDDPNDVDHNEKQEKWKNEIKRVDSYEEMMFY